VEIKNGLGKATEIEYLPHTKYGTSALLAAADANQVPYAVHTVSRSRLMHGAHR